MLFYTEGFRKGLRLDNGGGADANGIDDGGGGHEVQMVLEMIKKNKVNGYKKYIFALFLCVKFIFRLDLN